MKTSYNLQAEKELLIKSIEQINDASLIKTIETLIEFAHLKDEEYLGESIEAYNEALETDAEMDAETRQLIMEQKNSLKTSHDIIKKYRDLHDVS